MCITNAQRVGTSLLSTVIQFRPQETKQLHLKKNLVKIHNMDSQFVSMSGSAFFYQKLLRAVQFSFNNSKSSAQFKCMSNNRRSRRPASEKPLDFRPKAPGVQPQHERELERRHQVRVDGDLSHGLAAAVLLHAQVDEGAAEAAGLADRQMHQLVADVLQEFLGNEQFGTVQDAVFGVGQVKCDELHHFFAQRLFGRVKKQVRFGQIGKGYGTCGRQMQTCIRLKNLSMHDQVA